MCDDTSLALARLFYFFKVERKMPSVQIDISETSGILTRRHYGTARYQQDV